MALKNPVGFGLAWLLLGVPLPLLLLIWWLSGGCSPQ
jgi:hypothetical protein